MSRSKEKEIIKGLLFLWGDPFEASEMARILKISEREVHVLCREIREESEEQEQGILLRQYGNAYQWTTNPAYEAYYVQLAEAPKKQRLSNSALETLSIIAYNQPVTRIDIENIRGVKSSASLETLLQRNLIEEAGRLDKIGRPILYRTTEKFLQLFEIASLEELPALEELEKEFPWESPENSQASPEEHLEEEAENADDANQ